MFAGAVGTVAVIVMALVGLALSFLFTVIPARGNWHFDVAYLAGADGAAESGINIALNYLLVLLVLVPFSWLALALLAVVPGIVIGLVYESLDKLFPQQKPVTWVIYAMAAVAALPSSIIATQAQFDYVPFIWVLASLLIGIATCLLTLEYRSRRGGDTIDG